MLSATLTTGRTLHVVNYRVSVLRVATTEFRHWVFLGLRSSLLALFKVRGEFVTLSYRGYLIFDTLVHSHYFFFVFMGKNAIQTARNV